VQAKEWWNVELEIIVPYIISDGVRPISARVNLAVGPSQGAPSASVTQLCRPPRTCVAPDADHGVVCT